MGYLEIALVGIGLACDAFAVSITNGMQNNKMSIKKILLIALVFGVFQAAMPLIGYYFGSLFEEIIIKLDHWIAFVLLGFLGGKMIVETIKGDEENSHTNLTLKLLLIQGVATSIDALMVGVTFVGGVSSIYTAIAIIGAITFVLCLIGVFVGKKSGDLLASKSQIVGGLILIFIGVKTLIEHLFF